MTIIFFLFFFFTFSSARIPFHVNHTLSPNNPTHSTQKLETSKPKPQIQPIKELTETESSNGVSFTVFSFDPRIPRRPLPLSLRHDHHHKPWKPRPYRRDIGQRNDVRDNEFNRVAGVGVREIPIRRVKFGHIKPMWLEKREFMRGRYHRNRHEAENKDTGFVKSIRKFLKPF